MSAPHTTAKPAKTPASRPPNHLAWTLGLIAAAVALLWGLLALQRPAATETEPLRDVATEILDRFNEGLPREFAPGLQLERVGFEGTNLVMILRSEKRDLEEIARDPRAAEEVRASEQAQMRALCKDRDMLFLLARGASVTRRFVDRQWRPIFDVSLRPADCLGGH